MRKDAEQGSQHTLRPADVEPFMEMEAGDVSTLVRSTVDESQSAMSLMANHSAYINVSQSDDDSQQTTSERGCLVTR